MRPLAQTRKHSTRQWHRVRLQAQQLAVREHELMKLRFNRLYMAARRPRGMNLWMSADGNGGADLYLSPRATPLADKLIDRYRARPCGPPTQAPVLVAGDGYTSAGPHPYAASTRTTSTTHRFLPVGYTYRCVRSLTDGQDAEPSPGAGNRMAPFVHRYAKAWGLSPPPRWHRRWNQGVYPCS